MATVRVLVTRATFGRLWVNLYTYTRLSVELMQKVKFAMSFATEELL